MRKTIVIICAVVLAIVGAVLLTNQLNQKQDIVADSVIAPSDASGNIPEKIIGDADKASLIVFEYADYGCSHCAEWNKVIEGMVDEYDGKLAVVFRGYDLGFNNGTTAALAATAAQLQGYWKEYKNYLFNNQAEWIYSEDAANLMVEYFEVVSGGKGNVAKFTSDMNGEAVRKRVNYEGRIGDNIKLRATPTFRINGEQIEVSNLQEKIEELLK